MSFTTLHDITHLLFQAGENNANFFVKLEYGYGFERYGAYEDWRSGWNVTVNGKKLHSCGSTEKTYAIPMALLLAEHKLKIKSKGDPHVRKPSMSILSWRVLLISTNCTDEHQVAYE